MMTDDEAALDDPVGRSLGGRHAHLAGLLGPRAFADLFSCPAVPPPGWEPVFTLRGRQLVLADATRPDRALAPSLTEPGTDVVGPGADDVPEMLRLVARTEPGDRHRRDRAVRAPGLPDPRTGDLPRLPHPSPDRRMKVGQDEGGTRRHLRDSV